MWRQLGQQHSGLASRRLLLGSRRGGCYAQALVVHRHHGTSSSSLTRLLLDRETASTTKRGEAWKWYACGPTVYDSAHLGHARTYVCQDIIRRVLTDYFRQDVMFVMGVTDVDDKILRRASESQEDPLALARQYEAEFWRDMRALNVMEPTAVVRVTEHMDAILAYIKQIQTNGFAYETGSGVYFDVAAFVKKDFTYGKLGRVEGVQGAGEEADAPAGGGGGDGSVVGREEKRDRRDFVLWKRSKAGEESMCWDSRWGRGRPGWHIECSAMTHHLLGERLEIHSGGVDLCFPHHTNEIAQCEAFGFRVRVEKEGGREERWSLERERMKEEKEGGSSLSSSSFSAATAAAVSPARAARGAEEEWVKVWLHTGHLYIQGLKMSKSLKNFITIRQCLERHHADDFRVFCLQRRYGANVDYSESAMQEARSLRRQFSNFVSLALSTSTPHHDGLLADTSSSGSSSSKSKRWGPREVAVMTELNRVKASVREALLEGGIDTPEVLRLLQGLVATGHVYMQGGREGGREEGRVEEVLGNVAGYVVYMLRLFGLQSIGDPRQPSSSSSLSSPSSSSSTAAAATENLAGALVDFRARVRAAALEDEQERRRLQKAGTTDEKMNSELSQTLLQLCDDFRDGELARLGLQVKDLGAGKCHWTLEAPPSLPPPSSAAPAAAAATAALPVGRQPQRAKASVALSELFRQGPYEGQFFSFDALGIPTADARGQPISKTLRAKLEKKHARHAVLLAEGEEEGGEEWRGEEERVMRILADRAEREEGK